MNKKTIIPFGNPHLDQFDKIYQELHEGGLLTIEIIQISQKIREFLTSRRAKTALKSEIQALLVDALRDVDLLFFTGIFLEKLLQINFFTEDQVFFFSEIIERHHAKLSQDLSNLQVNTRSKIVQVISILGTKEYIPQRKDKVKLLLQVIHNPQEDELVIGNAILALAYLGQFTKPEKSNIIASLHHFKPRTPYVRDCLHQALVKLQSPNED